MLAHAFRIAAHFGWTEGVRNHFSVELSNRRMAVQNEDVPWSRMTPRDLVVVDLDAKEPPKGVSVSAFYTHRDMHRALGARARCILHLHPPSVTTLSCLRSGRLEMVHQNAAYFYGLVGYYDYPAHGTETTSAGCEAVVKALGESFRVLLQASHGVLVIGESVYSAFDDLFYFENACGIYCRVLSTGQAVKQLDENVCKRIVAMRERDREEYGKRHFLTLISGTLSKL